MIAARQIFLGKDAGKKFEPAQWYGCTPVMMDLYGNTASPYITDSGILVLSNPSHKGDYGSGRADLPFTTPTWNKEFEVVIKVDWKDRTGAYGIFGQIGNADGFTPFWYNRGLVSYMKNVGWPIAWSEGGNTFISKPENQSQILGMRYDGVSRYDVGVFEDGVFVKKKNKISSGVVPGGGILNIGSNRGQDSCLYADVDLNYCYIRFNGALLWEGTAGAFERVNGIV